MLYPPCLLFAPTKTPQHTFDADLAPNWLGPRVVCTPIVFLWCLQKCQASVSRRRVIIAVVVCVGVGLIACFWYLRYRSVHAPGHW